jgi:actin, other eukaryote
MTDKPAVVIDNGSGICKAGISGEEAPKAVFPSIIGIPHAKPVIAGTEDKDIYVGEEANQRRGICSISYPIEHGIILNWDHMATLWRYTFDDALRVKSEDAPVLLTEAPLNPKKNKEKMAEYMFETFNVPKFYVGVQAVLALYASGRTTGLVLDSGDGVTHTVPIYEGFSITHAIMRQSMAGRDLTAYMVDLLKEINVNIVTTAENEITKDIKEKTCYVAYNPDLEIKMNDKGDPVAPHYFEEAMAKKDNEVVQYQMPDGVMISLADIRFRCAELLFNPTLKGKDYKGIHQLTYSSINECDIDLRKSLYENIILSGGTTLYKNFPERLEKEMKALVPAAINPKVYAASERKFMVWCGGATAASISSFTEKWIEKKEYTEVGPNLVHMKCL